MNSDPDTLLIPAAGPGSSPLESAPAGEAAAIAAVTQMIETKVKSVAAASGGVAHRDAHPKAHGTVEARFEVRAGLPPELAVGLFAAPATYSAWLRFSNGNGAAQGDKIGDGRGVAIKVMGVAGSRSGTQDFIMINAPRFFVRDATDYVAFQAAGDKPMRFFFPGLNPFKFRLHELMAGQAIAGQTVSNPLNIKYFSMTPYLYGAAACKFSIAPAGPPFPYQDRAADNFLHDNMVRSLQEADAVFDFRVQLRKGSAMPVEDPTIAWDEAASPFIPVARIVIAKQSFDAPDRLAFGEALSFTPWHGLDAHRPLGGINRVRRVVYETISTLRHQIDGTVRVEPAAFPDAAPPPPLPNQPLETPVTTTLFDGLGGLIGGAIDHCGWADTGASNIEINLLVNSARNRPHPWSTASDYTSWKSLTDKTYQGRWLPAAKPGVQPSPLAVAALFERPTGEQLLSKKSTCLFPAFAQYLTDGFILTIPTSRDRTKSNHDIDLCQLYGRNELQTDTLRAKDETAGRKGRLKTQTINGEEYPPFYFLADGETVDPTYAEPMVDSIMGDHQPWVTPDMRRSLFAVGGERANSTPFTVMMNTLFLREHNRVAGELESRNSTWDDERVFQTARNIIIPIFIKIVVEQYINHISPAPFNLTGDPTVAWHANWNRPNWITAEFSLLYRWHSLLPDVIDWPTGAIPLQHFTMDNRPLIAVGLNAAFAAAAAQPAAELGALNTSASLIPVEQFAILQGRSNHLASYNDYRVCFGMKRAMAISDITSDPAIAAKLAELYPTVDDIEFYPGIFAEDRIPKSPLPGLLARMVAVDAFSQALTNPLLSEHVFNADTFTDWGFELIKETRSLGHILAQHTPTLDPTTITMTQPTWSYGWHIP